MQSATRQSNDASGALPVGNASRCPAMQNSQPDWTAGSKLELQVKPPAELGAKSASKPQLWSAASAHNHASVRPATETVCSLPLAAYLGELCL